MFTNLTDTKAKAPAGRSLLERWRLKFSAKVVAALGPLYAASVAIAAVAGHANLYLLAGISLAGSGAAFLAWRKAPAHSATINLLAAALMGPPALLLFALAGTDYQFAAVACLLLFLTLSIGWTRRFAIATAAGVAIAAQIAAGFFAQAGYFADSLLSGVLIAITIIHALSLNSIVGFSRRTARHFESLIAQSGESKGTIQQLAASQSELANRETARREALQKIITSFDTEFLDSFDDMLQNLSGLKSKTSNMNDIANRTNDDVRRAASASDESSQSITTIAGAVEQLARSISAINDELISTNELTKSIETTIEIANRSVDSFDSSIHRIDDIVAMIRSITNQINLLALNATIEAARAGEAGRGFAVVANEVKSLANQTAAATQDVAHQISEIKMAAAGAFESARTLSSGASQLNQRTVAIAESVGAQDDATKTIHENMARVTETVKNMAAVNENVLQSSQTALAVANNVLESTETIQNQAINLESSVHKLLQRIASS